MNLWRHAGADVDKLVVLIPLFGQTFELLNEKESMVGALTAGPGLAGKYTQYNGFLAYYEVFEVLHILFNHLLILYCWSYLAF